MRPLRYILDRVGKPFEKGGKLEKLHPFYEVIDTFFYTPKALTSGGCHVRDAIDFKRMMSAVLVALLPCVLMAMYNTGYQAFSAMGTMGVDQVTGWHGQVLELLHLGADPHNILACLVFGALYFVPLYIVCMVTGIVIEIVFAVVRGHEVNEGFFVTGLLLPLTLPPTIPWWQVAMGTAFGVIVGKEVFGGTGRNFLNPALTARAFLFFAYPAEISGNAVWTAVDGFTGATPLSLAASDGMSAVTSQISWWQAFFGVIPGSMGETSAAACLLGAVMLWVFGVASWRIMASMLLGAIALSSVFYVSGSTTNPMFAVPPAWHLVLGGFAFGLVFMATDPVTAAITETGQWLYGGLVGAMVILIRVVNPAFPEGTMLAILFGNVCAPLIDYYVVRANIQRRALRHG